MRLMEQPSPVVREFTANRRVGINWKMSQGGILSPSIDYDFLTGSTLVPFELNEFGKQRTGSELANKMLLNDYRLVDFGLNNNHSQNITINMKPVLPNFIGLNKLFEITSTYNSNYWWRDPLQNEPELVDAAKSTGVTSGLKIGVVVKLKDLGNSIFGPGKSTSTPSGRRPLTTPDKPETSESSSGF